jgi:SPP1 family predicted phage head-tail adaptor
MPLPRISSRPPGPGTYTPPGAFTRWVTINNPANPTAGVVASPFCDTWAAMRSMSGQELEKAQQIAQHSTHIITVPYQPGIPQNGTVTMFEGSLVRTFQVEWVDDVEEKHIELRFWCFEMQAQTSGN